jgi:hypothetical protein
MRNLKEMILGKGSLWAGGPSVAGGKRRQTNVEELVNMDRPGSLCKVVGFLPLSPGLLKRGFK